MIPRLDISFPLRYQRIFLERNSFEPSKDEFLLNHSRSCILLALKSIGLSAGTGVGVMVYNCHTVMNAVEQAGFKPVFLDVTDSLTLDFEDLQRKEDRISAVVVTHLFGIVNDVRKIRERYPDLVIIEDCAHAYGIENLYGDFATFSIGQGKLPSIGDGGILKVLNDKYKDAVNRYYSTLPNYNIIQSTKLFLMLWLKSLMHSRCIYGWLTLPFKKMRGIPSGREIIAPKKMCKCIASIYAKERDAVPKIIESRKRNAQLQIDFFPKEISSYLMGMNAFMLVVFCDKPKLVQSYYRKKGIDSDTHFAHSFQWATEFGYKQGDCPNAEKICKEILVLPTYCDISTKLKRE